MTVEPFSIAVPDAALDDLRDRLGRTRWPDQLAGQGWQLGAELGFVQRLCEHWRTRFDWRATEARLNALPQVRAIVDGVGLHAVHARSDVPGAVPLLIANGWPSSILEYLDLIPRLTAAGFHVVAPALPGYGFSDRPTAPGTNLTRIAGLFAELMGELGYDRFLMHGSDMGAGVAERMRVHHPGRLLGVHFSNVTWRYPKPDDPSPAEQSLPRRGGGLAVRGGRLRPAPGHQAADAGVRADRQPGRARSLDRREVQDLDRRRPRAGVRPGRAVRQPDALLGHGDHHLVGPALRRGARRLRTTGAAGEGRRPGGGHRVSARHRARPARVGRALPPSCALDRGAAWRALPGLGDAGSADGGPARLPRRTGKRLGTSRAMAPRKPRTWQQDRRAVRPAPPDDLEKQAIVGACEVFIRDVLKPRFLPRITPTEWNYVVDIHGAWSGFRYRFMQRYRSGMEHNRGEEFDSAFARIDRMGPDRFDIHWMRHTGRWWRLHTGKTLVEALHILETDGVLHPV